MKDYYEILGVNSSATELDIKKKFRKLAAIYHPDKNSGSKKSEELFRQILEANEILSDIKKRAEYDSLLKQDFRESNTNNANRNHQQNNQETNYSQHQKNEYKPTGKKSNVNYVVWFIIIIIVIMWFFNHNDSPSTNNSSDNRPESGEIKFQK